MIAFSLNLPREEHSVPLVRHICRDALTVLGVQDGCVGDVELAVTEACTNVLKHAAATKEEYEVCVEVDGPLCDIRVIDAGGRFDHESLSAEGAAESAETGRGIFLMRALVDQLNFVSKPETGTIVHLEKSLELRDDSVLGKLISARSGSDLRVP